MCLNCVTPCIVVRNSVDSLVRQRQQYRGKVKLLLFNDKSQCELRTPHRVICLLHTPRLSVWPLAVARKENTVFVIVNMAKVFLLISAVKPTSSATDYALSDHSVYCRV